MATADEILATMAEEAAETGQAAEVCTIDRCTRAVTIPEALRIVGVETDKDVTRRVFRVLCSYRGTNLSTFRIRIHFMNANKEKDIYYVTDAAQDGEYLTFSWVISRKATKYKGKLQFIACMVCDGGSDEEREWNSTLGEFTVLEGLEVELTEGEEEQARDAIAQLLDVIDARETEAVGAVSAEGTNQVERVKAAGAAQERAIEAKGAATLETIPGEYTALYNNVQKNTADILLNAPAIIPTATGGIVTVTDASDRPAVAVISHIVPKQEGSGNPSPDNVRPISGWDAAAANVTGVNLFGGAALADKLVSVAGAMKNASAGTVTYYASSMGSSPALLKGVFKPNTQYTLILYGRGSSNFTNIAVYYSDGTSYVTKFSASTDGYIVYTTAAGKTVASISGIYYDGSTTLYYDRCGVFEGVYTTAAFVPYQGQTPAASLPETVCAGTLNWVTGALTVTHHKITFDGVTTGAKMDGTDFVGASYAYMNREALTRPLKDKGKAFANKINGVGTNSVISISLPDDLTGVTSTDAKDVVVSKYNAVLKQWYDAGSPLEIVYELAAPVTYQLTPRQISTIKGTCNAWSDTGDTELSYIADTKMYIDDKLAAIAAAALNM